MYKTARELKKLNVENITEVHAAYAILNILKQKVENNEKFIFKQIKYETNKLVSYDRIFDMSIIDYDLSFETLCLTNEDLCINIYICSPDECFENNMREAKFDTDYYINFLFMTDKISVPCAITAQRVSYPRNQQEVEKLIEFIFEYVLHDIIDTCDTLSNHTNTM